MRKASIIVIGAGAAGMTAAISALRAGAQVTICERLDRPAKKLLASGGGRCNCANEKLDSEHYNQAARPLVRSVLERFGLPRIKEFLDGLGLRTFSQDGRIFPVTNQASSVARCLELELERLGAEFAYSFDASAIHCVSGRCEVSSRSNKKLFAQSVIIAGGGSSYPALGSNGSCYELARGLGHTIIEPVPACVPLVVKDQLCHLLQGQRVQVAAECLVDGKSEAKTDGELIFTKYGLSGTAILDVSVPASIALNRHSSSRVELKIDLLPFMARDQLVKELAERGAKFVRPDELITGLLPNKFGPPLRELLRKKPEEAAQSLKGMIFRVSQTRGWNEAEFTAGGVDTAEVDAVTLASSFRKNVYFCGEVLDVNGQRGGYNLAWAWASGYLAGGAAAATS